MKYHTSVLLNSSIESLSIKPGGIYIDATLGHGGHTLQILQHGATVYGFDQDINNLQIATSRIQEAGLSANFHPIHDNFKNILLQIKKYNLNQIDGLIADLGLSFDQQSLPGKGFSFNDSTSLDMRLDSENQQLTAEELINTADLDTLYQIFTKYAQEHYSKPLILRIIRARQKKPIKTAIELADIIRKYYQDHKIKSHIDPATKIFMALRIYINQEYENLQQLLEDSLKIVKPGGTISIITFHSGEDRIVKQFIKKKISENLVDKTSHLKPSFDETKNNPLSRSSILRSYTIK